MDPDTIATLRELGFPGGFAAALLWILWRVLNRLADGHLESQKLQQKALEEILEALKHIGARLDHIEGAKG